ncbi:MAG: hypothetical protein H6719_17850 [Sandaracinaceae bacterium]|nr:hypothetical protein [Sandaracinaceae bacterium]
MRNLLQGAFALALLALAALVPTRSRAEMWCADALWVHEWGVQVFGSGGARRTSEAGPTLPGYFHAQAGATSPSGSPVRHLPVDSGMRELPVVHFYAPTNWRPVPLGFEVGFTQGEATRWYPQVDVRRSGADANGAAARTARARLVAARSARSNGTQTALPGDPRAQLGWDHLTLSERPAHPPASTSVPWVTRARGFDAALWVDGATESERFLFYESQTRETPALRITRGPTYGAGRRHVLLENTGAQPIHDVFLVHRERGRVFVLHAPTIPAGRHAGFVLEDHAVPAAQVAARTRAALRDRLVDAQQPAAPSSFEWRDCVMMRDPAIPFEAAEGHALYAQEVDAILDAWGPRLFGRGNGTTVVYREDVAYLDEVMPLAVYSDMYHFARIRRLGLALMENAALP